jgi:hypothetical protein
MVDLSWFRRRQQRGLRPYDKPARERHILSVVCSCLSVVVLILSLSLQEWGKAETNLCKFTFKLTKVVITNKQQHTDTTYGMTDYYSSSQQILISCIISVSALAMVASLIAATISSGYPREKLEFLRHYSVFNVISLLCIVLVAGLWLGVAQFLPTNKQLSLCEVLRKNIESQFSYAYYLMLVGGIFSLGAAAFNLLFARTAAERRRSVRSRFR